MKRLYYLTMLLTLSGYALQPPEPANAAVQKEIVFCIDVSGSISSAELKLETDGLDSCLTQTVPNNGSVAVGIVTFNNTASIRLSLTPVTPANLASIIRPVLNSLTSGGGTNIPAGLQASQTVLAGGMLAGGAPDDQFILLTSDGVSSGNVLAACNAVNANDITICAIGIGNGADVVTLQNCAVATGGEFDFAPTFNEFLPVCEKCLGVILGLQCDLEITSPKDGSILCSDKITVAGRIKITGGVPPYTITACEVNGNAATVTDTTFSATLLCPEGINVLIASCTIVDSAGTQTVCTDTIRVECLPAPICSVEITSPQNNDLFCVDSVTVQGITTISGGVTPFTVNSEVNGFAATVSGNMFTATVPVTFFKNDIIATSTITDSCGRQVVCADTINVLLDDKGPTCRFEHGENVITGTFIDSHSGISQIIPVEVRNGTLIVEPFNPGDVKVNFRIDIIDPDRNVFFSIDVLDVCGNSFNCDPVFLSLSTDSQTRQHRFSFPIADRYFELDNQGLTAIRATLNGHKFTLYSDASRVENELNAYPMPYEGKVAIDLLPYLQEKNDMQLSFEGPLKGAAQILISSSAENVDYVLDLERIPEDFQLAQNYPNPFNPSTTIRFDIPERLTEEARVQLKIYNLLGELVRTLVDEQKFFGQYTVEWDGKNHRFEPVASGIYIYQLTAGEFKQTRRMLLLK